MCSATMRGSLDSATSDVDEPGHIRDSDPDSPAAVALTRIAELLAAQVSVRRLALANTQPIAVNF